MIVGVAGAPVVGPPQLVAAVELNGVGKPLELNLIRAGSPMQLQVIPTEFSAPTQR